MIILIIQYWPDAGMQGPINSKGRNCPKRVSQSESHDGMTAESGVISRESLS
jgi:hypothetical protein